MKVVLSVKKTTTSSTTTSKKHGKIGPNWDANIISCRSTISYPPRKYHQTTLIYCCWCNPPPAPPRVTSLYHPVRGSSRFFCSSSIRWITVRWKKPWFLSQISRKFRIKGSNRKLWSASMLWWLLLEISWDEKVVNSKRKIVGIADHRTNGNFETCLVLYLLQEKTSIRLRRVWACRR